MNIIRVGLQIFVVKSCCDITLVVVLVNKFLLITNLMHFFHVFIYSFHLSTCFEHQVLIIRRSNCINTSSGMISLC
jgi:hypothetical protein